MRRRVRAASVAVAVLLAGTAQAAPPPAASGPRCEIGRAGELAVEFLNNQPVVKGAVGGQPIRVLLDTGATSSMMLRASAARLKLRRIGSEAQARGVGGFTRLEYATIPEMEIAGVKLRDHRVWIGGETAASIDLMLGSEVLMTTDLEFDLAHGMVRFLTDKNCADDQMAYWSNGTYSQAPMTGVGGGERIALKVLVNGKPVNALLDSGAPLSHAVLEAATRAQVKLGPVQGQARGVGAAVVETQVGQLDSFTLGDETIRNPKLLFAPLFDTRLEPVLGSHIKAVAANPTEMLLGADFLRAHRVLISPKRRMIYFTYEGGPVFQTGLGDPPKPAASQAASSRAPAGS